MRERRPAFPPVEGLPREGRAAAATLFRAWEEAGPGFTLGELATTFLHDLAADPPESTAVRLGAGLAVRTLREAGAGAPRWPARVDPGDEGLRREGFRLAALATLALTRRTGIGRTDGDPDDLAVLPVTPADDAMVRSFVESEAEILRRKQEVVPYPVADFLADLADIPRRLDRPEPILPEDRVPAVSGPFRIEANHEDRVVKLYDYFRDKYGSPRGERRADLYLAVLAYLARHRRDLEAREEMSVGEDGEVLFRDETLAGLLGRPLAWFESPAAR